MKTKQMQRPLIFRRFSKGSLKGITYVTAEITENTFNEVVKRFDVRFLCSLLNRGFDKVGQNIHRECVDWETEKLDLKKVLDSWSKMLKS
jgi:hypothetical protein